MELNGSRRRIKSLHISSSRVWVRLDYIDRVITTVDNRTSDIHWLLHSWFIDKNRHNSLCLWLALCNASHLRNFHSRSFWQLGNLVPPRWKNEAKLRSFYNASVLKAAVNLNSKLLRRTIENFDNDALDEDISREIWNHSPNADALSDIKLQNKLKSLITWKLARVQMTYIGQRRNSITDNIETPTGEDILVQLLLALGIF